EPTITRSLPSFPTRRSSDLGTEMRITFAGLPFEKMRGVGAKTYETYKTKYGKEPTSYALYAAEGTRVIIDAIKRAAAQIDAAKRSEEHTSELQSRVDLVCRL